MCQKSVSDSVCDRALGRLHFFGHQIFWSMQCVRAANRADGCVPCVYYVTGQDIKTGAGLVGRGNEHIYIHVYAAPHTTRGGEALARSLG